MSKTLDQMASHLEFLGYKIEKFKSEVEGVKEWLRARHPTKYTVAFFELQPNFVMFRISVTGERKPSAEMAAFLNNANSRFLTATKQYYDVVDGFPVLRWQAVYTGDYVKETFGQFFTMFEGAPQQLASLEGFGKIFLKE